MKYFLDADDNGNWYVVPACCRREWNEFLDRCIGKYKWDAPGWARRVDGGEKVEFENPIGGGIENRSDPRRHRKGR